jgi:hypothetical protein
MAEAIRTAPDNEPLTAWAAQPRQAAFIASNCYEVFFGGARGGGKTDAVLGDWGSHADLYGKDAIGLMVRRQRTELIETIERSRVIYGPLGWTYHEQDKMWRSPDGARLRFAYLERDADADGYQGHSYTRVYVEEIGSFPSERPIRKLMATLRSGAGVPVSFKCTGNPGGPGHQHVRRRYVDPAPAGWERIIDPLTGLDRIYIPSRIADNKYLGDQYVQQLKGVGSETLVRAWLEGDWSVVEGAFFDCWSSAHVIRPFEIPADWLRFRSCDWGSAAPASVGWWAVAQDDYRIGPGDVGLPVMGAAHQQGDQGAVIPRGALVRYREWYVASGPNIGLKLTAEEVADGIKAREQPGEKITYSVMDPAAFAVDGGPSIAERMGSRGVHFSRADNKRVSQKGALGGWDAMRQRLKGEARPMIYTFSTCVDSIRTIPALQHDLDRPEDVDTDAEDHAADEWRYACMSRPWVPKVHVREVSKHIFETQPDGSVKSTLSIQELIDRQARLRKRR